MLMDWVKALHVIAVIAWMAGVMYLPRLFVYHVKAEFGSIQSETFKLMERRLYRGIILPAMVLSFLFGLWMVGGGLVDWSAGWPWVKAIFVLALAGITGMFGRMVRDFASDQNQRPEKFFRIINELPFVFAIVIVIMVIVKPF
jgi:putative membrane protein